MGCNQSKSKDIAQSRQRIDGGGAAAGSSSALAAQQQRQYGSGGQTRLDDSIGPNSLPRSPAVNAGAKGAKGGGMESTSYTDRKLREKQMFQAIIDRTQQNFIDISQSPGMIDYTTLDTNQLFENDVMQGALSDEDLNRPELFGLPAFAPSMRLAGGGSGADPTDVNTIEGAVRDRSGLGEPDSAWLDGILGGVAQAVRGGCKVNAEGVGSLVIQLPAVEV